MKMKMNIKEPMIPFNKVMTRTSNSKLETINEYQFCQSSCQCGGDGRVPNNSKSL